MARVREVVFGLCVLLAMTSVHCKLTMHQQHLKMHEEMMKKKQQATATKQEGGAKTEMDATLEQQGAGQEPAIENQPKIPEAKQPPKVQSPEKAASGHTKKAPKQGDGSKEFVTTGHSDPKEASKKQSSASKDTTQEIPARFSATKSQDLGTDKQKSQDESRPGLDTAEKNPASQGDAAGEQRTVSDDDLMFIDKDVGAEEEKDQEDAKRYPDPDLDNEDGGIGDPEGGGAGGTAAEEENEEEEYHSDDYFDNRQPEEAKGKAKPKADEEMVRSLSYRDFEDVLYDEKYNMLHFVSEGCKECERFRPHFREAARKLWQVEDDSTEEVRVNFYEVTDPELLVRFNLRWLPTVFFFRDGVPILYEGDLNVESLVNWTFDNLHVRGWSLTDNNFDRETEETKDPNSKMQWLIHFCDVDAVGCDGFMATWESAAARLKDDIYFGYVDAGTEPGLIKRFDVNPKKLPAILLLKQGQAYWCTLPLIELTTESIVHFAKEGHLKIEKEEVPSKLSTLEAAFVTASSNIKGIGITMALTSLLLYIVYICICRKRLPSDVGNKKAV